MRLNELADTALADLAAQFPGGDLTRVRGFLDNIAGRTTPVFHPYQQSESPPLHFPGLPDEPFLSTDLFPEARELTDAFEMINEETSRLIDGTLQARPFTSKYWPRERNEAADEPTWRKWKRFMFYDGGASARYDDNCRACPATSQLIDRIVSGYDDFLTAGILIQEGRMTLKPHVDNFNLFVSLFLPLTIPGPCGVGAAAERRPLEAGKCVAFDNSYLHYSWNDSDSPRTVLALYRLTPRLTPIEAAAWVHLKKTYGYLFARAPRSGMAAQQA